MIRKLLDALLPATCASCGEVAGDADLVQICATCADQIPGHVWPVSELIPCVRGSWYLLQYAGMGGALIRAGKYGGRELLLGELAELFAQAALATELPSFDLIVAAPGPWRRLADRGFSAPQIFSTALSRALSVPQGSPLKREMRPMQAGLQEEERAANVSGAYELTEKITGAKILLVDDVVTTGATATECAETLLLGGAESVHLLTFASVLG